jgi:aspartate-semialdehyde dehydrogenase
MLLAVGALYKRGWVEWMTTQTYQAASGAGARNMVELLKQMQFFSDNLRNDLAGEASGRALEIEKKLGGLMSHSDFPQAAFGYPLAANLLPWIDSALESGQSREEWKGQVETNKILGNAKLVPIDGTCVRVGALRCHSQAMTLKLYRDIPLKDIEDAISADNEWVRLVPNDKAETLKNLTPQAVSGKLDIPVGRLRKMTLGNEFVNAFTCGDQLLWGAAEPLRRMLRQVV